MITKKARSWPTGERVHFCVDTRNMFAARTAWHTPWMERVLPNVERIVRRNSARGIFTRFVLALRADEARRTCQRYYRRWHTMTLNEIDPVLVELVRIRVD